MLQTPRHPSVTSTLRRPGGSWYDTGRHHGWCHAVEMRTTQLVSESFPMRPRIPAGTWWQRCADLPESPGGADCPSHAEDSRSAERYTRAGGEHAGVLAVPAYADAVVAQPGSRLEPGVRESMQERMGYDFARVRVHADTSAARSARALGALAYTVGEHIVFDTGRYAPGTD